MGWLIRPGKVEEVELIVAGGDFSIALEHTRLGATLEIAEPGIALLAEQVAQRGVRRSPRNVEEIFREPRKRAATAPWSLCNDTHHHETPPAHHRPHRPFRVAEILNDRDGDWFRCDKRAGENDNPQFNAEVAAALFALAQSRQLTLNYRVVEETAEVQATQAKFEAFNREMPAAPPEGQRLGDYQRAVAKFQTDLAKWKNDYLGWRDTQQASAQAWLAGALRKQTETSQRFARELARRRGDYRRSDVCGAVLQAAKMDFPQGYRGYLVIFSDLQRSTSRPRRASHAAEGTAAGTHAGARAPERYPLTAPRRTAESHHQCADARGSREARDRRAHPGKPNRAGGKSPAVGDAVTFNTKNIVGEHGTTPPRRLEDHRTRKD